MRAVLVLIFVTGCQLVFTLEDKELVVEQRTTFTREAPFTNRFIFEPDPDLEQGDLLIAMIQARSKDDIVLDMMPGWELVTQEEARGCVGSFFHVWFLRTIVTPDTVFDFSFDMQDDMTAIVTAYRGANSARLMELKLFGQVMEGETTFAADEISPRSVIWLGGGAQTAWADSNAPAGMEPIVSIDHLSAYELVVPEGSVPEITMTVPSDGEFCANVAQIKVEP